MTFQIMTAGLRIGVNALYPTTAEYCGEYVVPAEREAEPDFTVTVTEDTIAAEREIARRVRENTGNEQPLYADPYYELLALYRGIAERAPAYGTVLFHGSVVAVDGEAYCFGAKSGTGKSTHARLWREAFGGRAVMVNDDKPLMRVTPEGVFACGTPWNGKHRLGSDLQVPLKAFCILERAERNAIRRVSYAEALPMLYQQCYRPSDPAMLIKTTVLLDGMKDRVAFYLLGCNMDPEAALVSYRGMNPEKG